MVYSKKVKKNNMTVSGEREREVDLTSNNFLLMLERKGMGEWEDRYRDNG
jgi:hypothetical protein